MKNFARRGRIGFVALGALAIMLAVSAPSQAAGRDGHFGQHGSERGHFEGREGHHFEGHDRDRFEGHERDHFEGRGRFGFGFGFGPIYPYYPPYYSTPGYWYYCPSYQGYYPYVSSCPEAWVPIPAQ